MTVRPMPARRNSPVEVLKYTFSIILLYRQPKLLTRVPSELMLAATTMFSSGSFVMTVNSVRDVLMSNIYVHVQ